MKKIGFVCTAISLFFVSVNIYASVFYALIPTVYSVDYKLPPKEPIILHNFLPWAIKATCTILSPLEDNQITISVLSKSGMVNDKPLTKGDTIEMFVKQNEKIYIEAAQFAKFELTNQTEETIVASCTTGRTMD